MQDQIDSFASPKALSALHGSVADLVRKVAKPLGYLWLVGASMTWMLCPSPAPLPASLPTNVRYADEAAYFVECLSVWPAIAYLTLEHLPEI